MGGAEGTGGHECPIVGHWGPRTPPAPPGHEGVFPKPDSVLGTLLQLRPTPERAPALPAQPFGGTRNAAQPHPSGSTGGFLRVPGYSPTYSRITGWGSFLETFMQLIRFQECVSELEQGFSVMILL